MFDDSLWNDHDDKHSLNRLHSFIPEISIRISAANQFVFHKIYNNTSLLL